MKVSPQERKFSPVSITITFESEDEAAALFALVTHTAVIQATVGRDNARMIRDAITTAIGEQPAYEDHFGDLKRVISQ